MGLNYCQLIRRQPSRDALCHLDPGLRRDERFVAHFTAANPYFLKMAMALAPLR
jgi:hypothetical protein